jgi:SAM-dependent methyltransferase
MSPAVPAPFDAVAEQYDALWTSTAVGRVQREAVWRIIDPLFRPGDFVLDLGCGTGIDALHLMARGVSVHGIDSSPEMVRIARARGVSASTLSLEALHTLPGRFDGAISNFGPLNCVERTDSVAPALARLIRPGGVAAVCVIGEFCLRETLRYLGRGAWRKAFRRLRPPALSSIGVRVAYPSVRELARAFHPHFRLTCWRGIGVFVPPSYVPLRDRTAARLDAIDRRIAGLPVVRAMADHRLLIFERL